MSGQRVIVVGAGIVGASIAYHLARQGARVTLVEAREPAAGVTRWAFAWLNIAHTRPHPYQALRQSALGDWHRLEVELPGRVRVTWCGALSWDRDLAETERLVASHAAAGYDVRLVERAEVAALEPALRDPPVVAAYAPVEGAVDPVAVTTTLVDAARQAGAEIRTGTAAGPIETAGDRVVGLRLGDETLPADTIVAAAGMGNLTLCESVGLTLPIHASPAILLRMTDGGTAVRGIVSCPDFEIRADGKGGLLSAADYIDDTLENGPEAVGRRTAEAIRAGLRGADGVSLISAQVGWRPMPRDGAPIVGAAPGVEGLYVAAMHAGIILAPVVGRLAAAEILGDGEAAALAPCRLARFRT